jgi:hypothetical protein
VSGPPGAHDDPAPSNPRRPVERSIGAVGWAKALGVGIVVWLATGVALAFVGVPYFGLFGYLIGGVVAGRIVRARTWRRWAAAFALLFVDVLAIGIAAIVVLSTIPRT